VVERPTSVGEIPVEVERVIFDGRYDEQCLVFREVGGSRRLLFVTGAFEAAAIRHALKGEPTSRPLTHQGWVDTVAALGATVQSAGVIARRGDTYFAEVRLLHNGVSAVVDVRPSDALMVALRAGVPFLFVEPLITADSVSEPEPA